MYKTKQSNHTFQLIEISLYAALIIIGIYFFRFPMPSAISNSFVHMGNALVAVGALLMGSKRGAIAASIGLLIFDITAGYATSAPFTVLESLIVILIIHLVFFKLLKGNDKPANIIITGIVAALTKLVVIYIKFLLAQMALGLNVTAAMIVAFSALPASVFTAFVTAILVPILYFPMKRVVERFHPVGQ